MRRTPRIVAVGGGGLRRRATLRIDAEVVRLTGKKRPRVLFVPTATGDDDAYTEAFVRRYAGQLGCRVEVLRLFKARPGRRRRSELILGSDLVYVGGGNTFRMVRLWRRLGVDRLLRRAAEQGIVLAGTSAGGICWFRHGHSDSRCKPGRDWDYIRVGGLGLVDALFCPHYHEEKREASLDRMLRRRGGVAVACDRDAAIEIVGKRWRVITSTRAARAYKLFRRRGEVVRQRLAADGSFRPLCELLA